MTTPREIQTEANLEIIWKIRKLGDRHGNLALHYLTGLAEINPDKPLIESLSDALEHEEWMVEKNG